MFRQALATLCEPFPCTLRDLFPKTRTMTQEPLRTAKLSDVARLAGVGNATVSRVLNGRKNVSPDKTRRVLQAIEALHYTPDRIARSLKGAASGMIGMIVPSISDMFFSQCAEAVETVARQHGSLLIVMASHDDPSIEFENVQQLLLHRIDGLILSSAQSRNTRLHKRLRELTVPVVGLDRPLQKAGLPSIVSENFQGAKEGTGHLLDHGHKLVLCLHVKPELYTIRERVRGYMSAMKAARLQPVAVAITSTDDARACIAKYNASSKKKLGIFVANNLAARYTWQALKSLGLDIPTQVALLCFDDFDLANTLAPPVSVVQQPVDELGKRAAKLLFERMRNLRPTAETMSSSPICLPTQLILRQSCGCHSHIKPSSSRP